MPFAFSVLGSTTFGQEFFNTSFVPPVTVQPLIVPIDNNYGSPTLTRWEYVYPPVFAQVGVATYFIMSGSEPISTTASLMMIFTAPDGTVSSTHQVEVGKNDLAQATGRYIGGTFAIGFVPTGFLNQAGVWQIELVVDLIKLSAIGHFVVQSAGPVPIPPAAWGNVASNTIAPFGIVLASDTTGSKLIIGSGSAITQRTVNKGATWTNIDNTGHASTQIASSSDGTILATANGSSGGNIGDGKVYVSSDSGGSWAARTLAAHGIVFVSVSGSGAKMAATSDFQTTTGVWVSTNGGASFALTAGFPTAAWQFVAYSRDGSTLYAGVQSSGNTLYKSTNDGVSASNVAPVGGGQWINMAVNADASVVYAVASSNGIWKFASNAWTNIGFLPDADIPAAIATSDDGLTVVAATFSNNLYISHDGASTWTLQAPTAQNRWTAVTVSGDGTIAAAIEGTAFNSTGTAIWVFS